MALEPTIIERQVFSSGVTSVYTGEIFTCPTDTSKQGGAIVILAKMNATVTLNSCVFDGNTASSGGAIYAGDGNVVSYSGNTFSNNYSVGYGGAIDNENTNPINYSDMLMTGNTASNNGGALYGRTINLLNASTISGNAANNGGGIYAVIRVNNATNSIICNNYAKTNGGGIFSFYGSAAAATCVVRSSTVSGNTAGNIGGGILAYVGSGKYVSVISSLVSGNYALKNTGGGIVAIRAVTTSNVGTLFVHASTVKNNYSATGGGGVYGSGLASAYVGNSTVSGNTVNSTNASSQSGAGIYFNNCVSGTVCNSIVTGNLVTGAANATGKGGGLAVNKTTTVMGSTFSNNVVQGCKGGGGIYAQGGNLTVKDKSSFIGNTATNGGGIWFNGTNYALSVSGSTFTGNRAGSYGGAVYISGAASVIVDGCVFSGNTAVSIGGAIYATANITVKDSSFLTETDIIYVSSKYTLTLQGRNVFNANINGSNGVSASGSTVTFANSAEVTVAPVITVDAATAIDFNGSETVNFTATQDFSAAAITVSRDLSSAAAENSYTVAAGNLTFDTGNQSFTVYDTNAKESYTVKIGDEIGKTGYTLNYENNYLYLSKGTTLEEPSNEVTMLEDVIDPTDHEYSLREAAVVYASTAGQTVVSFADGLSGDVVFTESLELKNDTCINASNSIVFKGLHINSSDNLILSGASKIADASVSTAGGAVYSKKSVTVQDFDFTNCSTEQSGGAIYSELKTSDLNFRLNANLSNNTAEVNGGAIYVLGDDTAGNVEIGTANAQFEYNKANSGGAVYVYKGNTVTIGGENGQVNFTGNTASGKNGGALLFTTTKKVYVSGGTFTGNLAAGNGGAIHNVTKTDLEVSDSIFTGNRAGNGGGINSDCLAAVNSSTFTANTASNYGGALYNTGTASISGSTFSGNHASYGGAVCNTGTASVSGSTFSGNIATYGGAIYSGGILTIQDSAFLTSSDSIYNNGSKFTLKGSNTFAADIYSKNAITATDSTATFVNADTITVTGALTGLSAVNFKGGTVNFVSGLDLTGTAVSIDCELPEANNTVITVASGVTNFDLNLITVHGSEVNDEGIATVDGCKYRVAYDTASKSITLNALAREAETAGSIISDGNQLPDGSYASRWTESTTIESSVFAAGSNTDNNIYLQLDGIKSDKVILVGGTVSSRTGKNDVKLSCGTVSTIYGGGYNQSEAAVELKLEGGSVTGDIFGGSRVTGGSVTVTDVDINVSGSVASDGTSIYGAGFASGTGVVLNNTTTDITVSGGNLGEAKAGEGIFGVGFADNGAQVNAGTVTIALSSGTVGNVFGGGWAQKGGSATAENVTINISGNVTGGFIYGGGAHSNKEDGTTKNTTVNSVAINVDNNTGFKAIFAGGQYDEKGKDSVTGNATITVTGTYAGGFTTNLFGEGYDSKDTVTGTSTLVLDDFTGCMKNRIYEFDVIKFTGNGSADLSEAVVVASANGWVLDFTDRTDNTAIAAAFNNLGSGISLLTDADLLTADSWQLFTASTDSFGSDWSMDINGTSVELDKTVTLGDTDWTLTKVEANTDAGNFSKIILSKVTK